MIGEKWLSDVIFTTVRSQADLSKVKKASFGDFVVGELSKAVNTKTTNEVTVRAWLARAKNRRSTMVFCVDIAHVTGLTNTFREHGIDARYVTGQTAKKVRSERLDAFRAGEYPVLINCGVFTEGTDVPNIDCILLARPTRSRNLLVQMIGRGMRLHHGKENCHVIDMVASLETGIVTVPTLFGLDPSEIVKEANVKALKELRDQHDEEDQQLGNGQASVQIDSRNARITFTDYDSVFDLIDDTSGERHIRAISQLAWVQVDPDRYILSSQAGAHISLEHTPSSRPRYRIRYTPRVPTELATKGQWRPYQRTRDVGTADTFIDAVHAADTFATATFPRYIVSKDQAWRNAAATPGQLAFLNKLRNTADELTEDQITKGKATDMITKVKFGAKGRLDKIQAAKRRVERGHEKLAQAAVLRERESVRVGPLVGP